MKERGYQKLYRSGELEERVKEAYELLSPCRVCPRNCRVDRKQGEKGVCQAGFELEVASFGAHFGEERPLVGRSGSGTIFFSHCNLRCIFCQNYDISQIYNGEKISVDELALIMLELQRRGCHNINFVSPTHYGPQILGGILEAARRGLNIPLVYNTGGYDSLKMLKLLDGVIDIYMPDAKYASEDTAERLSGAGDYPQVVKAALKEMHRQVGDLEISDRGVAEKGLLVRHLVLPNGLAGTREIMRFIAQKLSPNTYVNVMSQYRPMFKARRYPEINRSITREEFQEAMRLAEEEGIKRLDERRRW